MHAPAIAIVLCLFLLSACATPREGRLFSSQSEVTAAYGEPGRRWQNADGSATLAYPTQPYGEVTMMYVVAPDGRVVEQYNALSDENLARVERGMSKDEVSRLLGPHRSVQSFGLSGEEVWDWNIRNDYPGIVATLFNVHFIDGRVVRTSRSYIYPNENDGFGLLGTHEAQGPFSRSGWFRPPGSRGAGA